MSIPIAQEGHAVAKPSRGKFLNFMILLLIIGDLQIPYFLLNPAALGTVYGDLPSWYAVYAILGLASNVAIIIGMWSMKKWSAYLLALYFVSKVAFDFAFILPSQQLPVFATSAVGAGLWAWAIYRKWAFFD
jgi:hypothetical protein